MAVSASETYNTAVEHELRDRLGVRFVERPAGRGRLPVREIDGIPKELLAEFSCRRRQIESGYEAALARYRVTHGHDAPRHVQYRLAQAATLEARPDKTAGRSWASARAQWLRRAREVLREGPFGDERGLARMVSAAVGQRTVTAEVSDEPYGLVDVEYGRNSRSWRGWDGFD